MLSEAKHLALVQPRRKSKYTNLIDAIGNTPPDVILSPSLRSRVNSAKGLAPVQSRSESRA